MSSKKSSPPTSLPLTKVAALLALTFVTAFFWGRQFQPEKLWPNKPSSSTTGVSVITKASSGVKQTMNQAELEIVTTPWTGWSPRQPANETTVAQVAPNDQLKLESTFGRYFYQVSQLDDRHITLSITSPSAPVSVKDGGINLLQTVPEITLTSQQSIKLATPSMDAGVVWTITLKKITTQ